MQKMEKAINEKKLELKRKMESTKQKCYICDSHFENLDIHFLTSHEPIENSNYKTASIETEEIYDVIDPKKETSEDPVEHDNNDIENDHDTNSMKSCDLRIDPFGQ